MRKQLGRQIGNIVATLIVAGSLLWLSATASAQSGTGASPSPGLISTYNEPLNRTVVETPPVPIKSESRSAFCKATYSYPGKVPQRPENVVFELWATNRERVWTTFIGRLLWSVDGGKALAPAELVVRSEGKEFVETITCEMPVTTFQTIFQNPQVGIGVYGVALPGAPAPREDYRLSARELEPFRALLGTIPGGKLTGKPEDFIQLPFKSVFGHMVVQAVINGRGPLNFIVDTGAPTGISRRLATEMSLKLEGNEKGHTPDGCVDYSLAANVGLQAGDLKGTFDKIPVIPIEGISPYLGMRIDGLLGSDFLRRMTVEIDYDAKSILFHDPATYTFKPDKDATELPITFTPSDLPLVSATLKQGGKSMTGNFAIDTGSSGSITVFNAFSKRTGLRRLLPRTGRMLHGSSGVTLGGKSDVVFARIAAVRLGELDVDAPQVELSADETAATLLGCDGLLGSRLLRRFRVVLDFSRKRMILIKSQVFAKPDRGASAGVLLRAEGDEFYPFKIEGVLENSPAADADLRAGDSIVTIDDAPTKGLTLEEVQNRLDRENHEPRLMIQRDAATLLVKLRPRQLFLQG